MRTLGEVRERIRQENGRVDDEAREVRAGLDRINAAMAEILVRLHDGQEPDWTEVGYLADNRWLHMDRLDGLAHVAGPGEDDRDDGDEAPVRPGAYSYVGAPARGRMSAAELADWFESLGPDGRRRLSYYLADEEPPDLEYNRPEADTEVRPVRQEPVMTSTGSPRVSGGVPGPDPMATKA